MNEPVVLVTGGTGFTGRYFIQSAAAKGYRCVALSMHSHDTVAGAERLEVADLTDREAVEALVRRVRPDYVVHLAAVSFVAHGDVRKLYLSNIVGTVNLLDALAGNETPLQKVLIASSANVYGNARQVPISEETPLSPMNDYGVSKYSMERAVQIRMNRLPVAMVRPFNYTGVGQAKHFLIPKIVSAFKRRDPRIELGNLDVARDFSDVRDVVSCYLKLLEAPVASEIFNVCSGKSISLLEVIEKMNALAGYEVQVDINPAFVRANEIKTLYGTDAKLTNAIGPYRQYSFDDTLGWMNRDG